MTKKTYFVSDLHFNHKNIITFTTDAPLSCGRTQASTRGADGSISRQRTLDDGSLTPFQSIEEHDEHIIEQVNKVVRPQDRLYIMGDVAMNRSGIKQVGRMNGRKKLIKGNHDIFKLADYTPYFEDILASRVYPQHNIIVTHIPVAISELQGRFKYNLHGHTHINTVPFVGNFPGWEDLYSPYINLCPERVGFAPISLDEIVEEINTVAEDL